MRATHPVARAGARASAGVGATLSSLRAHPGASRGPTSLPGGWGPPPPARVASGQNDCRVDSGAKRNGLGKADLDVPAKLLEQGLERGEEAEALPRREIVAQRDLLQLGVAE